MKTKQSFITNSSSSSFVVCIHQDLKLEELKTALLENAKEFVSECGSEEYYDWEEIDGFESAF